MIVFYFFARLALAGDCETFHGYKSEATFCWNEEYSAFLSKDCKDCKALEFLKKPEFPPARTPASGGQNPASLKCRDLKLPVVVFRDPQGYEKSFCQFSDGSYLDSGALDRSTAK